jgi:N-acetylneuraminate synthase
MANTYIIAEIGINHNGSLAEAIKLIDAAIFAGASSVKFQKREPRLSVPKSQWDVPKKTPWGEMPYIEYKERMEFGEDEYAAIDRYCKEKGIDWFASAWDIPSVGFLLMFDTPYIKVPSAMAIDRELLECLSQCSNGKRVMLSTGMCDSHDVKYAVELLKPVDPILMHCTSTYPCPHEELNLQCVVTLQEQYPHLEIGYSGHETGLATTVAAVVLGAKYVERHITLNRAAWGSDHAASIEPAGFIRLIKDIRAVETSMGDGVKRIMPGEEEPMLRLRGVSF